VAARALDADEDADAGDLERDRSELLARVERALEWPMLFLGLVWVSLVVLELTSGLSGSEELLLRVIWTLFIGDFLLRLALAPRKLEYVRAEWLTILSLAIPALRIGRAFRAVRILRSARFARALRLVRIVGATNRGTRALGRTMQRRGLGYVVTATALVTLVGAAGLRAFEADAPGGAFDSYGEALWFTAMLITTIASERWPQTVEGRVLCFLLSLYAMGVLGYIAAALASHFVGRDAQQTERKEMVELKHQLLALAEEMRALNRRPGPSG
jgi:voltage-gated potassium channel